MVEVFKGNVRGVLAGACCAAVVMCSGVSGMEERFFSSEERSVHGLKEEFVFDWCNKFRNEVGKDEPEVVDPTLIDRCVKFLKLADPIVNKCLIEKFTSSTIWEKNYYKVGCPDWAPTFNMLLFFSSIEGQEFLEKQNIRAVDFLNWYNIQVQRNGSNGRLNSTASSQHIIAARETYAIVAIRTAIKGSLCAMETVVFTEDSGDLCAFCYSMGSVKMQSMVRTMQDSGYSYEEFLKGKNSEDYCERYNVVGPEPFVVESVYSAKKRG
ncbi:MAG: hypothetical protein LBB21_04130, partial [Holosporaceae bacterium]|nr:hypothetical protein [Holosporaceae bacterium]